MRNDTFEELYEISQKVLKENRFIGTKGHKKVKETILHLLESKNIPFYTEDFTVDTYIPKDCKVSVGGESIPCVAYIGSPSVEIKGFVKKNPLANDIALCNCTQEEQVLRKVSEENYKGIVTYMENFNVHYYGYSKGVSVPVVNVKQDSLKIIEDAEVHIKIESIKKRIKCSNIIFEIGKGPIVYVTAHIDTRHEVFGAMDNGIGFLILPLLYEELRKEFNVPYRFRFMITDAGEVGLEGSWFHVNKGLRHVFYCINLDAIGWSNPAVIYSDSEGENGERVMNMFYNHIKDLRVEIDFKESKNLSSDHIPFKKQGVQTLFLSSHPFSFRHTFYDILDAVNWDIVRKWFDVILSFLRRIHRL